MAFRCPSCTGEITLVLVNAVELPPDAARTELTLQLLECRRCGFLAVAVYEEAGTGDILHQGYPVADEDWIRIRDAMLARQRATVADRLDPLLGRMTDGEWRPPAVLGAPAFPVRLPSADAPRSA